MSDNDQPHEFEAFTQALDRVAQSTEAPIQRRGYRTGGGPSTSHKGQRDLWSALGYPADISHSDYREWYDRGGIAKPIIEKPPQTTWKEKPRVTDRDTDPEEVDDSTSFESDIETLFNAGDATDLSRGLRHYFERADILGRIGRFSVLFLGLADAESETDLAQSVETGSLSSTDDLLYVTPLGEGDASIDEWVEDPTDPRNGLPETYSLNLSNGQGTDTHDVHWTRVIHVAEGVLDNEVYGEPALRAVINRLHDIEKIAGSAAEAYWRVSNPGLALSVDSDFADVPTEKMDKQVEEWEHKLRRVLKLYGTDVEQLDAQDVDPEPALDSQVKLIAGTADIPQRKLVGSERGELASSMDEATYLGSISERQTSFAEPVILRPFIDRLEEFGIISPPRNGEYTVEWPDLFSLTELEQAELKKIQAESAAAIAPMGDISSLHSEEALQRFSPIEEPEEATPPADQPDPDEEIDPENEQVVEQFAQLTDTGDDGAEADD